MDFMQVHPFFCFIVFRVKQVYYLFAALLYVVA